MALDLHEGGHKSLWGVRQKPRIVVLYLACRLCWCATSPGPHAHVLAALPLAWHLNHLQIKKIQGKPSHFKTGINMRLTSLGSAASSLSQSPFQAPNFRRTLLEVCSIHLRRGRREIMLPANPVWYPHATRQWVSLALLKQFRGGGFRSYYQKLHTTADAIF